MTGFSVDLCDCGHAPAEHLPAGASLYAVNRGGGRCMAPGCDCLRFHKPDTDDTQQEKAA